MKSIFDNMKKHNSNLSKYASNDEEAIRLKKVEEDFRTPYFRDIDKILYSLSYTRYIDKTQVFSFENDDMISKRMTHIQLVSKIARTIGRGLGLNEDLIEAASLGHDLGHVPFGHEGEKILNRLSLKYKEGFFNHNVQSVRILMELENKGLGINVTLQTLDSIFCHNGEQLKNKYEPMANQKTVEQFLQEYKKTYYDENTLKEIKPMTLEGCVVRISDIIAYIGKDIEDAIRLGKIKNTDLPLKITDVLGNNNSQIVNTIVVDIIENSLDKNFILISNKVFNALKELISFNYEKIYLKANTKEQLETIEKMFTELFDFYYQQIINKNTESDIYKLFLNYMCEEYIESTTPARKVIDYIAGMTDNFFIQQYKNNF